MIYSKRYGLRPGDRIIEPIFSTGLSKHHAIYLGIDHHGIEWIAENYKFNGVRKVKGSDYFTRGKKFSIKPFVGNYQARIAAVQRALSLMGEPYDLINFNCEHYAEYVQRGEASSKQVDNVKDLLQLAAAAAIVIGVVNYLSND